MKRKMILRWTLCAAVLLATVVLISGIALAQTGSGVVFGAAGNHSLGGSMDQLGATILSGGRYRLTNGSLRGTTDQPDATMLSGGRYRLTDVTLGIGQVNAWQESDLASGGGYHLKGPASPQLTGNGCCCMYLPCVRR